MTLSDAGEARIHGYLFMLERSLRTVVAPAMASEVTREMESHIRERARESSGLPNERDALERLLGEFGMPDRIAQAYSLELVIEEAVSTGHIGATARAVYSLAVNTVQGFFVGLGVLIGYMVGVSALLVATLKPIFPNNVGVLFTDGEFRGIGAQFWLPPNSEARFGWIVAATCAIGGFWLLVLTHRLARGYLARVRDRSRQRSKANGL